MAVNWTSRVLMKWIFLIVNCRNCLGDEAVLMDTRTATSDVGWTMPQGSEWQEVSSPHPDGSERRMLMVCRIHEPKQNNWVRTPYIPIEGAERIYVEFEFTIRSCEDVENVATCKETFNLYYYETDRDEATTTFPPWKEGAYVKVDTIAADKRFRPGSEETNFETRDIGPLSKKGIYLALQDTGACMAIMHVRVYYKYCSPTRQNLASFPRTISGPERASLVESQGICVDHALTSNNIAATLHCNSDGEWTVPKGECVCGAGFDPNPSQTSCRACARGFYKASGGNRLCQRCPAYSHSRTFGAKECDCMFGYFRATSDDATAPCTKSPSVPINLRAAVNHTRVVLSWDRPLNDGGRNDLTYRVECSRCQSHFTDCTSCSSDLGYIPMKSKLLINNVEIWGLSSFAFYKFKVFAENAVTDIALKEGVDSNPGVITIETEQAAPSRVEEVHVTQVVPDSFLVTWNIPGGREQGVELYQVQVTDVIKQEIVKRNETTGRSIRIINLKEGTDYIVEVRARSSAGYGPFSLPSKIKTKKLETTFPPQQLQENTISTFQILIALVVGIVLIVALVLVTFFCKRRNRRNNRRSKIDLEKYPMFNTSTFLSSGSYPNNQKTYIDPTTYEDPQRAVLDFTKEIDASCISIEQVIGGGEFGEVCRGHMMLPSTKKDHDVAIKTLKTGYSTQQKLDFLGEASIMGQFEHPNVIRLEGVVTRSRPFMIITEYMENGSLDSFLRKHDGEFTVLQLVGMLRNIAAGMKYLSDMGYVHRDLAARNILVNAQLVCKVSDFGLSRVLEEDEDATYTTRGGKIPIRWTSPEAITYRKFTSASDVWSFGIVMWEVMSYGERPYWGMSNQDVIQAVGTGYRLPAPMDCPQVQHQLMVDCWKKNRNERPKFSAIVTSIDKMLRDPSLLKEIAGQQDRNNGCLLPEGSFARLSRQDTPAESMLAAPLLPPQSFSNKVSSRNSADISSLGDWLASIGLGKYKENFIQCGCSTLEQILRLKPSDLEKIGITDINHQNTLLESVYSLRRSNEYYHSKDPPQYGEELVTGIPV